VTTLQWILTVPFALLFAYTVLGVFHTFKLMLYKGSISDDVKKKHRRRFKIVVIGMLIYSVFAACAFFINYLLTRGK
jgi:uncharacterized protein YhhL (DUF1145 family)